MLVRPPYHRSRLVEISHATVERAVHRHGFEVQDRELSDWRALISLLQEKRAAIAEAEGAASLPDNERMAHLVRAAPRHILERYLDRVGNELIPQNELEAALRALAAMSHADIANMDAELRERVSSQVAACGDALMRKRDMAEDLLDNQNDLADSFPNVKKTYGDAALKYAKRIQESGQIFAFGS